MAFSAVPTVATGDTWTASQHNTYIKNNFAAAWPYTTLGDIVYANTPTTLARIPIGSNNQSLIVSGGVPTWSTTPTLVAGFIKRSLTDQTIYDSVYTKIEFDNEIYDGNNFWSVLDPTKIVFVYKGYYRIDGMGVFGTTSNTKSRAMAFGKTTPSSGAVSARAGYAGKLVQTFSSYYYASTINDYTYFWAYQDATASMTFSCNLYITYLGE